MPDDVKIVDDENDEARVPARRSVVLRLVFLLNVDILAQPHRFKWGVSADELLARAVRISRKANSSLVLGLIHGVKCLSPPQTVNYWSTLCSFIITLECYAARLITSSCRRGCECVLRLSPLSQLCGVNTASGSFSSSSTDRQ